jgi:hypothetical protein
LNPSRSIGWRGPESFHAPSNEAQTPAKNQGLQAVPRRFDRLVRELRSFITESRRQLARAVAVVQVRLSWSVWWDVVGFEQGGTARAEHRAKLLPRLAKKLTADFWRGFDAPIVRHKQLFHVSFLDCDVLHRELCRTDYRMRFRVEQARWLNQ